MHARVWLDTIVHRAVEWGYAAARPAAHRRTRPVSAAWRGTE